jgi:thioesterase domain-containing protein
MTVLELVTSLRERGVRLWVEDDKLRLNAPAGLLSPETVAEIGARKPEIIAVLREAERLEKGPRTIVPLKAEGRLPPLFGVPGHNGDVFCYVALARHLAADRPLLGLQPPGLDGAPPLQSVEALAAYHVEQMRRYRPDGPYLLVGYCAGGTIAFEIARQLTAQGDRVAFLALIATPFPTSYRLAGRAARMARYGWQRTQFHLRRRALPPIITRLWRRAGPPAADAPAAAAQIDARLVRSRVLVERATIAALARYRPGRYPGSADVFLPSESWGMDYGRLDLWRRATARTCEHIGPPDCNPDRMLREPHVPAIAAVLNARLAEVAGE